jgi:protein SCO1
MSNISTLLGLAVGCACALIVPVVRAEDPHAHHRHTNAEPAATQNVRVELADTTLRDQDGRELRFRSDAVGERIVVIDFVYTTCTTVCPVVSATLAQVQGQLGARLGADVALISVTVDPVRDTPARLKDYAGRIGARAGWSWLTGAKPQVDEVLKAFGAYTPNFADHPPLVMVGDAKSGQWLRFYGFPSADQLVKAVVDLTAARAKAGAAG